MYARSMPNQLRARTCPRVGSTQAPRWTSIGLRRGRGPKVGLVANCNFWRGPIDVHRGACVEPSPRGKFPQLYRDNNKSLQNPNS